MNNHRYKLGRKLTLDELEMLSGKSLVAYGTVQQLFPKGNTVYLGVDCNLHILPKNENIINPHTLANYPKETLSEFDKRLEFLKDKSQQL